MRATHRIAFLGLTSLAVLFAGEAEASLQIASVPTRNVVCNAGTCSATAKDAVLNLTDLASLLSGSDVRLVAGAQALDIVVLTPLAWTSSRRLTLDAARSIAIRQSVTVEGQGAVTLIANDGGANGTLSFGWKSALTFWDTSSSLIIGQTGFTLVDDIATLASDIAGNPGGHFALAKDYDATQDGTYPASPIGQSFTGTFEGLGHAIDHLTIDHTVAGDTVGLFRQVDGAVDDLHLTHLKLDARDHSVAGGISGVQTGTLYGVTVAGHLRAGRGSTVGGITGTLSGTLTQSHMWGEVRGVGGKTGIAGGLAGAVAPSGSVQGSFSTALLKGSLGWICGGLVGESQGRIVTAYASGTVLTGDNGMAGGLIGSNSGAVTNTYASGFVVGGVHSTAGGLVGLNSGPVATSYASGGVASGSGNAVGGLIGDDTGAADLTDTYWDITTSGQGHGVGNDTGYPGVTGLTTDQLQAGLPAGFDPAVWTETTAIHGGLPYLIGVHTP